MKRRLLFAFVLAVAFCLSLTAFAVAQEAEPTAPTTLPVNELITAGTAALVWALTQGVKAISPKLPRFVVWVLPTIIGTILTTAAVWAGNLKMGALQVIASGILSGAVAVWGNEGKTTVNVHGLTGKGA